MEEKTKKRIDDASLVLFAGFFIVVLYLFGICTSFTDVIYVCFGSCFMLTIIIVLYLSDKPKH